MFDWLRTSNFKKRQEMKKLRKWVNQIEREMKLAASEEKDPKRKHEIEQKYLSELFMYYDEAEAIKTDLFLSKNGSLPVSIPIRSEDSSFWKHNPNFGFWALTGEGFAHLDILFHEAKMRKIQRFQSWFTPLTSLVALLLSAAAIGAQIFLK